MGSAFLRQTLSGAGVWLCLAGPGGSTERQPLGQARHTLQGKAFRFPLRFACRARRDGARIRKINGCLSWGAGGAGRVIILSSPIFVYPARTSGTQNVETAPSHQ